MVVRCVGVVSVSTPQISKMKSSKYVSWITSCSTVGLPPPPAMAGAAAIAASTVIAATGPASFRVVSLMSRPA
jgi:hypothetical protein